MDVCTGMSIGAGTRARAEARSPLCVEHARHGAVSVAPFLRKHGGYKPMDNRTGISIV